MTISLSRRAGRAHVRAGMRRVPLLCCMALGASCGVEREGLASIDISGEGATDGTPEGGPSGVDASTLPERPYADAAKPGSVVPPIDAGGKCEIDGLYALRIEAQVRWAGSTLFDIVPIISPGQGIVTIDVLADIQSDGAQRKSSIRACGSNVPDFTADLVGERYGVAFPDAVWDKLSVRWPASVSVGCAEPGCSFATDFVTAQLGIGIGERAPWPSSRDPLDPNTLRDDDGDGAPGILLVARGPNDPGAVAYSHPPADLLLLQRISELQLAIRLGAGLQGTLESCTVLAGSLPQMTLDTRALGCRLDAGQPCGTDAVAFLDDNLPEWKVDSATWRAVRVPQGSSCAAARAAAR